MSVNPKLAKIGSPSSFIKGRNIGDRLTMMNTMSFRLRTSNNPNVNKTYEVLDVIYKDMDTGMKFVEEIEDPLYEWYLVKDEYKTNYPRLFIERDKVVPMMSVHTNLEKDIACAVGLKQFFYDNIRNDNRSENRKIHMHPDVFNSDMNIEDHYRFRFDKEFVNDSVPVSKAFFDIEADTINMKGDFPEMGECPINAVSLILKEQKQIYSFLLRTKSNPQIKEFEEYVNSGEVFPDLQNFIIDAVGGPEVARKYDVDSFKFTFLFYDEEKEIELIRDIFAAINAFQPDFALAWNMSFDVPYIMERIKRLGYAPEDIMCHPDFKNKVAYYVVDEKNKNMPAERGDYCILSSYTTFLDQMIHFASRRKNQTKLLSFSLDFVGEMIAKVKKLDYKNITTNISELPYKDYKTFVFYNIMDTIVQYCIEQCTGDTDYIYSKCLLNNTRYSKGHRQTVYLTNRFVKEAYNDSIDCYIVGNNTNKFSEKPSEKFPGAFVADPMQCGSYSKIKVYGNPIEVFDNLDDFDYSSLYPSLIRQFNIAANTQIGKITIADVVYAYENPRRLDNWTRECAFMEDMNSQVWLELCSRWFGLSNYTKLYFEVANFLQNTLEPAYGIKPYNFDGTLFVPEKPEDGYKFVNPIIINKDADTRRPINNINYYMPDYNKWEEWRQHAIAVPNQLY